MSSYVQDPSGSHQGHYIAETRAHGSCYCFKIGEVCSLSNSVHSASPFLDRQSDRATLDSQRN